MYFEITVVAVVLLFGVVFIATCFLEKQHVRDFVPAPPEAPPLAVPYFVAVNEAARGLGFAPAGEFVQSRGSKVYQARLAFWVSPDQQSLLRVAGGKTAGITLRRMAVTSFIEPGRIVETNDDFSTADLTGLTDREVLLNADLEELLARHLERLAKHPGARRGFSARDALAAFEAMQALRATEMERQGLGRFVNPERTVWRHTLKGAWTAYTKGLLRQMAQSKSQRQRITRKRPGDR